MQKNFRSIKGLINKEFLQKYIDLVNISMAVMKYLDDFDKELNISNGGFGSDMTTTRGIIQRFLSQKKLTLFLRERDITNMVTKCHVLGWKFYLAHELRPNRIEKKDHIEEVIARVVGANLVSYEKAKAYTAELIERFECRVKEKSEQHRYCHGQKENKIDLSTCKKGDILISSHGQELEYVCKTPWKHYKYLDHVVRYAKSFGGGKSYEYGTRTNDGFVFAKNRNPKTDHDIVKIIKKHYE